MTEEFYIGQIFEGAYPPEVAEWCNDRGDCYIEEIDTVKDVRRFEIKAIQPETEEEKRKRLNSLSMTRGDMFEAMILAFGKAKADLRSMIENEESLSDIERALYLNRFDEALEFYRGYPAIDLIGQKLGVTTEQLDRFFETKDYHELLPIEEETNEENSVVE